MPGPIPKRSDQRRRRNKSEIDIAEAPGAEDVFIPAPDPEWHHAALRWYESLAESGQAIYFEPSDWAQAWILARMADALMSQGQRPSSQLLAAWSAGATELLTTEGARRRLRMELQRDGQEDPDAAAAVSRLDEFRSRFQA